MKAKFVSDAVIKRLPRYRRYLKDLLDNGVERISSGELAEEMNLTASQIRQDLNHFGGFGQQGYGYSVENLHEELSSILGVDHEYSVVMVGCGRLGEALANYIRNYEPNFKITAICDIREDLQGKEVCGVNIVDAKEFKKHLASNKNDLAIITVPPEMVKEVVDLLVSHGVKGIWNFGLTDFELRGVAVSNVHLSDSLHSLVYYINHPE
jgi:redox-sensing transcriptional repressor